jgi:hypothetical protein
MISGLFRSASANEIKSRSGEKLRDVMNINDNPPTLL